MVGGIERVDNNIVLNRAGQPMSEHELRAENARLAKELKESKEKHSCNDV